MKRERRERLEERIIPSLHCVDAQRECQLFPIKLHQLARCTAVEITRGMQGVRATLLPQMKHLPANRLLKLISPMRFKNGHRMHAKGGGDRGGWGGGLGRGDSSLLCSHRLRQEKAQNIPHRLHLGMGILFFCVFLHSS